LDQEHAAVQTQKLKIIIVNIITNHLHRIDLIATTAKKDAALIIRGFYIAMVKTIFAKMEPQVTAVVLMTECCHQLML